MRPRWASTTSTDGPQGLGIYRIHPCHVPRRAGPVGGGSRERLVAFRIDLTLRVNPRGYGSGHSASPRHVASVLTRNIRELQGTPLQQFVLGHARAAASWLPRAHDGTHLPRVRTGLSGLPAGWNHTCASRPARTPSPPCLLTVTPRCLCLTVHRLHRARHVGGADDGAEAQNQWLFISL